MEDSNGAEASGDYVLLPVDESGEGETFPARPLSTPRLEADSHHGRLDSKDMFHTDFTDPDLYGAEGDKAGLLTATAAEEKKVFCGMNKSRANWCMSVTFLLFVTLSLVGTFVIGPALARKEISNTDVTFLKVNMTHPEGDTADPTQPMTFLMSADLLITNVAPLDGDLAAMDVDVLFNHKVVGTVAMPKMSVTAGKDNHRSIVNQKFTIKDLEAWDEFSAALLQESVVPWKLDATATVSAKVMGLPMSFSGVPFKKTVPMQCFDGLQKVRMAVFDMGQSTEDQVTMAMAVCVWNPSYIALEPLGDLFFAVDYQGDFMGNVTAFDAKMHVTTTEQSPQLCQQYGATGWNAISMTGNLDPDSHEKADELVSRYLGGLDSNVTARALPHASTISMFNMALQGVELAAVLAGDDAPLVTSMDFNHVMITPVDDDGLVMTLNASVGMTNPLGVNSPLRIDTIDVTSGMLYDRGDGAGPGMVGTVYSGATNLGPVDDDGTVHGQWVSGSDDVEMETDCTMTFDDKGAFLTTFTKDLIALDMLELQLDGSTACDAYCEALGYDLDIHDIPVVLPNDYPTPPLAPVLVPGMSGLSDVEIITYSLPSDVPDGTDGCTSLCGVYLEVNARIGNPSPFGMVIGTLNAIMQTADGVTLGHVSVGPDFTLVPGDNFVTLSGTMAPAATDLDAAADFMSTYLSNIAQTAVVVGTDAGEDNTVQWIHDVVDGLELATTFPGAGDDLELMTDITIDTMDMALTADADPVMSATLEARMNLPEEVGFPLDVISSGMKFQMVDEGVACANATVAPVPVDYVAGTNGGQITLSTGDMTLSVLDEDAMSSLVTDLLVTTSKTVTMQGTCSPLASTNMGELSMSDVPFEGEIVLLGFNNFENPPMTMPSIDIASGETTVLNLVISAEVTNPSNVAPSMGTVKLDLFDPVTSYSLGYAVIDDFSLAASTTTTFTGVSAVFVMPTDDDTHAEACRVFMSNYVSGTDQAVELRGPTDGSGTDIALLQPALSQFSSTTTMPGLTEKLLVSATMHLPSAKDFALCLLDQTCEVPTELHVQNPMSADITMSSAACDIFVCKTINGDTCDEYFDDGAVGLYTPETDWVEEIPGNTPADDYVTFQARNVEMGNLWNAAALQALWDASFGGTALIRLEGTMDIAVGDFSITLDFAERDVPVTLKILGSDDHHDEGAPVEQLEKLMLLTGGMA
mmetsp:Transcript_108674/g.316152  ORF Transcript_108674/g.316152 Transcript_108674/m.316152 type:complete len:1203 (+) Transcript_108674:260-3868(+)